MDWLNVIRRLLECSQTTGGRTCRDLRCSFSAFGCKASPLLATLFRNLERDVPGKHHQLISVDDDYNLFLFHAYGGISPGYFLVDRAAGKVIEVGRDYPNLVDDVVVDIVPVEYPSRDGLLIPGYLAVPKHAPG